MKKFLVFFLFTCINGFTQSTNNNTKVYTIDRKFDNAKVFFVDTLVFKQHFYYPRDYIKRIFVNDIALDSTRLYFRNIDFNFGVNVIGRNRKNSNNFNQDLQIFEYDEIIYRIDLEQREINLAVTLRNTSLFPLAEFYCATVEGNDSIVFKLDPITLKLQEWLTAHPHFPELGIYDLQRFLDLGSLWEIGKDKLLMEFVECSGDCFNYRYLTFDLNTKAYSVVKWYDSLRREETKYAEEQTGDANAGYARLDFLMKTFDEDFLTYGFIGNGEVIRHDEDYIFDKDFNIVSPALKKTHYSTLFNYAGGKRVSVMVTVQLDNNKTVFVPYRTTLPLERSFHKVYHNQEIFKKDLESLKEYELLTLKNFIFAKYNFSFDSEFYQAYFNLFAFYCAEEKRKSRTKEVNHLLSDSDKKNLTAITRELKNLAK